MKWLCAIGIHLKFYKDSYWSGQKIVRLFRCACGKMWSQEQGGKMREVKVGTVATKIIKVSDSEILEMLK